ncbi:hypothetical protein ACH518_17240 [Methylomonas sp. HW2-6]|uniref:hypothetical protein n=1 Tax=Methylomonas sp. HW2-6 TaxID=3376687 RepID=UPI0040419130
MPQHINSASRLNSILSKVNNYPANEQVLINWKKLFELEEQSSTKLAVKVSERLGWLSNELELVSTQMREKNFSENLYAGALQNVENAISIIHLGNSWQHIRNTLTPETYVSLGFCAEILPDEEAELSPEDILKIQHIIGELRELLAVTSISDSLRSLILNHICLIEKAIEEYKFSGLKALKDAVNSGLGDLIQSKDTILESGCAEPELNKFKELWDSFYKMTETASKVEKIVTLGAKVWNFLENIPM